MIKEVRSVESVVAQELEDRAVPLVCARLGDDNNLRTGVLAEFGSVGVALHVEFAHCLHAQEHPARSSGLHIVLGSARVLHAVEQEKILLRPVAGDGEVVSRCGIRYSCPARFHPRKIDHTRIERQQQVIASSV